MALKSLALVLYNGYRKVIYSVRRRFRVSLGDTYVVFVTEDAHSKRFFHYRYRDGGMHEPAVSQEVVARVRDARVFADVGAHLGYYACVAGVANPGLKLFIFEMNRNLVSLIARNLKANNLDDAVVINQAVSDGTKTIGYADASTDTGLSMHTPGEDPNEITAQTVSLDEFFAHQDAIPDVIKIDVQGAEMEVLLGAETIIRKHHPMIFLEVHPKLLGAFGTSANDIYQYLGRHGYQIYLIDEHRSDNGRLVPFDAVQGVP
ncbi:MAG: FkbM family methyltransferase, partial [Gammaproteobacteria bacterium]|nr:FkbM family methyltransferase [Gammaproteobacteria bacterium]